MIKPIWQPSQASIHNSHLFHFMQMINKKYHLNINDYAQLYNWSVSMPAVFWQNVAEFAEVIFHKTAKEILKHPEEIEKAKWFIGATLNFAENLLRRRDEHIALIFRNDNGEKRTLTYKQLYQSVAHLAQAMRNMGVQKGDRIAGYLPNMPETVIAMLATTSIGAIWSSCSPDFGTSAVIDRFGQIQPKILFTVDGYRYGGKLFDMAEKIKVLGQEISSIDKIVVINYLAKPKITDNKTISYEQFIDTSAQTIEFTELAFDHPVYIMFSSGTTGKPKCIVHGAGGTLLQHLKELMLHTDLHSTDILTYYTTCGWMMWNWMVSGLAVGATLLLYDGSPFYPHSTQMFDLIDQEKINIFGTSAKFISSCEKNNLRPNDIHQLNSLRTILSTGSPLLPMNFDYVYQKIKADVQLSSISGGTDIISCFALGCPILPIYSGELQCRGLGLKVEIFDEQGQAICEQKGELVCTAPFPSMPVYFYDDSDGKKYHHAYFAKFPNVWAHGDFAELTTHDGLIIYGRSDAVVNPGGIRIGTAEIYRIVEKIAEITESLVIEQQWQDDTRLILFVKLQPNTALTDDLKNHIKQKLRDEASPRHVPAKIIAVPDIPKTINGKIVELAVKQIIHHEKISNLDALVNPETLNFFKNIAELDN